MKVFSQAVTLTGIILSGVYAYIHNFSFEGVVAFLSFLAAFGATFFFGKGNSMKQSVGDKSKAYQAGRDVNIKE